MARTPWTSILVLAVLVNSSEFAYAQYKFAPAGTVTTSPTTSPIIFPTTASTPIQASINPAAATGQNSQNNGSGMNTAAGIALIASGMALMSNPNTQPMGAALMAMGMLALAQAGADNSAANQSGNTYAASQNGATGTDSSSTTAATENPTSGTGTAGIKNPQVAAAQQALANAGYAFNGSSLTTPDGSSIPSSAFNSESGMAAAGLDPSTYGTAQKIISDAAANSSAPKVSGLAVNEGGAGGGTAANGNSGTDFSAIASPFKIGASQRQQMIAGKTVNFDGEPIGVRGQDIFEMVHSAYNKRQQRGNFISPDSGSGIAVRSPASTTRSATKNINNR